MAVESRPSAQRPIVHRAYGIDPDPVQADDERILDQTGNEIRDQDGRVLWTDE